MNNLLRPLWLALIASGIFSNFTFAADPVRVILDTDISPDVDDVGSVAVLHALADLGEVEILGMGISFNDAFNAPCLDAMNTYYGRPDIPIGVMPGIGKESASAYTRKVAEEFPHDLASAADAPPAVTLYRRLLAGQPDRSVVLISIGPLTNVASLLASPPDENSDLNGTGLVEKTVRAWGPRAGLVPSGHEFNTDVDAAASHSAAEGWPTPIVFSGFEIGQSIGTGAGLRALPDYQPSAAALRVVQRFD